MKNEARVVLIIALVAAQGCDMEEESDGIEYTSGITIASSVRSGPIGRAEMLSRAQNWVDRGITYTQTGTWATDAEGAHTYRRDCSGLVSLAWHYGSSLLTHQ